MKGKMSIADDGTVTVVGEIEMNTTEIANLFGVCYQTAKAAIRAIEKSGVAYGDCSTGGTVEWLTIYPDYYGLDMVAAVAFRVQSHQAKRCREWVLKRLLARSNPSVSMFVQLPHRQLMD